MVAQLGDIVFKGLLGFSSFSLKYAERFADMPRITDKASIQHTGSELDLISLIVPIHREGQDIQTVIDLLQVYRVSAQVLPFLNGAGEIYGRFVITSMNIETKKLDIDGTFISVEIAIELKEYFDIDKERTEVINFKNKAKALSINRPNLVNDLEVVEIDSLPIVALNQIGISNATAAINQISKASQIPTQSESIILRTKTYLDKSISSFEEMKQKVTGSASILSTVSSLEGNINTVITVTKKMQTAATQGDLTSMINEAKTLSFSLESLKRSMNSINTLSILRKPF